MRKLLIISFLLLRMPLTWATGDSLQYLTPKDTVLLEINHRGQKLFRHRLVRGQTLYSLAQFYGMDMDMLYDYNPHLRAKVIPEGTPITVPIPNRAILRQLPNGLQANKLASLYYKVKHGDTLYGIAKRAFRMPVETLKTKNQLSGDSVSPGQILHVGWIRTSPIAKDWQQTGGLSAGLAQENHHNKEEFLRKNFSTKTIVEKGKAQWNPDDKLSLQGLYCLHATAPMGSVVRIENPITRNACYAKVLGKIPMNYEKYVVLVASKDVAHALQAIDQRFFVKIEYFTP